MTSLPPGSSLPPPPRPIELLKEAGLLAKKSWGQNFLLDQAVLADIARLTGAAPGETIVELGAGLGALTYHLLARGAAVIAIERDREIAPLLKRALSWSSALEVVEADAARLDYEELAGRLGRSLTVTGNLPYQLSSRILVSLADAQPHVSRAVVLLQREVADRLASPPGVKAYGLLSVLVQRRFAVSVERPVPAHAFHPRPKVQSAVVRLEAHASVRAATQDRALVMAARAGFHSRRKTLKNALMSGLSQPAAPILEALAASGIVSEARAETLSIEQFARLGEELARRGLLPRDPGA